MKPRMAFPDAKHGSMDVPSTAVCAFINAYIESIDFLRVLLLLARQPEREWNVTEVAAATALSRESAVAQLQRVTAAGLSVAKPETPAADESQTFQYCPRAAEFGEMVQELIQLDNQKPVTLIRLVYARKSTSAQAFADAFRLRRS